MFPEPPVCQAVLQLTMHTLTMEAVAQVVITHQVKAALQALRKVVMRFSIRRGVVPVAITNRVTAVFQINPRRIVISKTRKITHILRTF